VLELSTADDAATGTAITETVEYALAGRSITLFRRP
jgi:glycogen operon protein